MDDPAPKTVRATSSGDTWLSSPAIVIAKGGGAATARKRPPSIQAMRIDAVSLYMHEDPGGDAHPNKMPFSGILTRIDVASDSAPQGAGGKRILLTRAAAEQALSSLLGMGVDLKKNFDGHDAQFKVGVITSAEIDGDAINISGFIYCSDFPREALAIQLNKADLGFSFEASNLQVESMADDPIVIKRLHFTGAAILLKNEAAYKTTALAAAKAKEHEMDEIQKAVAAAMADVMAPLSKTLGEVAAAQAAQAAAIDELKKAPPVPHAALISKVDPHVKALEAAADQMERDGVGTSGHVGQLRRLASGMRADAAQGNMPREHQDSGIALAASAGVIQPPAPVAVKIEETAEFRALKASLEQQALELKASKEAAAVADTKLVDLTARLTGLRPGPERKTMEPAVAAVLARAGLSTPDDGGFIALDKVDAALSAMPNMDTQQRMYLKTALSRAGVIA